MSRFDRYLISQLLALFGFFSLLLVSVYWVNRAVALFDRLIGDGQSALVFLEFSLLTLPGVIRLVLPVSAFAAAVYVANRLTADSELVVMQATGFSAFRLARPVLTFGLIVAVMTSVLTHVLVPASRAILSERSAEISEDVTARFLRDGQFMHPAEGVTIYIREIAPTGELLDIFLSDDRNEGRSVSYTARRALLARGATGPQLLMFDGMAQTLVRESVRLSVTRFEDAVYDLSGMIDAGLGEERDIDELSTPELIAATEAVREETRETRPALQAEGHGRVAQPLLAVAGAALGFATLLVGAYSRFGLWRQILVAILLLVAVQLVHTQATGFAMRTEGGWPAVYVAPLTGIAMALGLLWWAQRPRRVARGAATGAAA